jgi:hypothetical protein
LKDLVFLIDYARKINITGERSVKKCNEHKGSRKKTVLLHREVCTWKPQEMETKATRFPATLPRISTRAKHDTVVCSPF